MHLIATAIRAVITTIDTITGRLITLLTPREPFDLGDITSGRLDPQLLDGFDWAAAERQMREADR